MKVLSSFFVSHAGRKLIPPYFDLSNFDNPNSSDFSRFSEFQLAFNLGVRFRESFSKLSLKDKKKLCSDFPISDIYTTDIYI